MPNGAASRSGGDRALRVLYDFAIFRMERHGGISRYIVELARRLAASGQVAPTIFAGLHGNAFVADRAATAGVRVIGMKLSATRARGRVTGALDYGSFGLYHATGPRRDLYHPSYYPRTLRRRRGEALVATVYDMIHERLPEFHRNDPTAARKRALVKAADRILCISETTAADLRELYDVDPSRITVTRLGAREASPLRAKPSSPGDRRPYFLYVGRRTGYKNFITLVEAYLGDRWLRRETALVVAGGGDWSDAEQTAISRGGTEARIERVDADEARLSSLYGEAIALCVPSLYEGFGLPVVEAMSAGCPVISNATGALPEIVGNAGIVRPLADPGVLAKAMRDVASDDVLRSGLRARGLTRARDFRWDDTAARTLDAYRQAVGAR